MFVVMLFGACKSAATPSAPAPVAAEPATVEPAATESAAPAAEPPPPAPPATTNDAYLAAHNAYRAQHCAPPLRWSDELARVAQAWADALRADGCAFEHSKTRYGENLAAGTSGALDPASTTAMWYREVDAYDFARPAFSMETGHFTQVVWAGTTSLGCGMTTCKGLDVIVCNYDPPGNVERGYQANVKPTGCK